jgi:NTP pyrophosphatase (non-canonical NTP hydrolase)
MTTFEHEFAAPATEMPETRILTFRALRAQNVSRKLRWHGEADEWTGSDWSNAMAGETGEACNIVKKLRRHETHTGTAYNTPEVEALLPALADELADVVTYADLLAHKYDIDLADAVRAKFNRVSEAQDFPERL